MALRMTGPLRSMGNDFVQKLGIQWSRWRGVAAGLAGTAGNYHELVLRAREKSDFQLQWQCMIPFAFVCCLIPSVRGRVSTRSPEP